MNDFLSSLGPTNTTLRHLITSKDVHSISQHRELASTVILNNEQSIQTCEANLKSLASIRRTYTLISSHSLDRTIKILTMVSVFISIPTMFFSMYGMNIGLPEQHNRQASAAKSGYFKTKALPHYR
jgi:Mg2+ and Co2+ transporter CorA